MSIKVFQKELADSFPSACYLIHSTDAFLLYDAADQLKKCLEDDNGFNMDVFDLKEKASGVEDIIDVANTLPFFNPRRVVLIRSLQKLKKADAKKLEEYLAEPSSSCLMVMLFEGQAPKLFDPSVMKSIKVIPLSVSEKDMAVWVKTEAERKGIKLTNDAVEQLLDSTGSDLGMLYSEIEKISSFVSQGSTVDAASIRETLYAGAEYSAFDLTDALNSKDSRAVFRIYEHMGRQQVDEILLGALNYYYAKNISFSAQQKRSAENAPHNLFGLLHEADMGIKSSHSFVIENLLCRLLQQR
ncbi:MAG: DNA polymerase III subunit delta [Nitrospirae bacterium]|nr:DNA polymerase III subunit delta [Nitrospirota bacterium]